MYRVTGLDRAASVTEAMSAHRREYLMERTELGAFMFSTCICGTLLQRWIPLQIPCSFSRV